MGSRKDACLNLGLLFLFSALSPSRMAADNPVWKACKPFATGSLAGMFATTCIQPVDMVKVRIQLLAGTAEAAGPLSIASNMMKNEGLAAFYKGLDAGLTRQVVYTGARLGLFDKFTP